MQPFPGREGLAFDSRAFPRAAPSAVCLPGSDTDRRAERTFAADPLTTFRLGLITARVEFDALEQQWNALFEQSGRPWQFFQSFAWLWHWANHYLDDHTRLSIITGRVDDRLVMVWPLVVRRIAGFTQLTWMGEPVSEYGDVLLEPDAHASHLLSRAWAFAKSLDVDLIYLRKVRHDAVIFPFLLETGMMLTECSFAPYLDLAGVRDFDAYEQRYPAKARSSRRRRLRRLNEMGSVAFEQHTGGPAARDLVDRALAMKRGWLARRGRLSPALQDSRFGRFLGDVAHGHKRSTGARISAVRCNGSPIGVEISFACKGHVFGHVLAHDLAFEKQGVGVILARYSIRTAHEQGYAAYDLLAPDDSYKMNWADACVAIDDYAVPISRTGGVYAQLWLRFVRRWLKTLANRMPARLASLIWVLHRRVASFT
jgi:CelD/BcsL family acetyltransferase involved in cellulose biosynthesis